MRTRRASKTPTGKRLSCAIVFAAVSAITLLATAIPASARNSHSIDWDGVYVGAGYAMVYAPDAILSIDSPAATRASLDYDLGFRAATLAAGLTFADRFRAELEAGYRRNELEVIEFDGARGLLNTGAKDSVDAFSGFANLYYEFRPALPIRPYVGAGIGFASVGYRTSYTTPGFEFKDNNPLFNKRDTAFAWQIIAGASMTLTPRTRLAAEYRYWRTGNLNFSAQTGTDGAREAFKTRHKLHMAGVQLQYFPAAKTASAAVHRQSAANATAASPPASSGLYLAATVGALAAEDSDLDFVTFDESVDTNFDAFDLGSIGTLAIGKHFSSRRNGKPLRIELEASHFKNDADLVDFGALVGEYRLQGDTAVSALAVNLLVDRPLRNTRLGLTPYYGIGLGYAWANYDITVRANEAGPGAGLGTRARPDAAPGNLPGQGPNPATKLIDDHTSGPLLQGLLGISVRLNERSNASLSYRYWWAPRLDLEAPDSTRQETEHSAHAIQLGLSLRLP